MKPPHSIRELLARRPSGALDAPAVKYALENEIASLVACERQALEELRTSPELAHLHARFLSERSIGERLVEATLTTFSLAGDCDVPICAFKGAAIARQAYANPEARASHDLDILVGDCEGRDLEEFLRRLGRSQSSASALATLQRQGTPIHEIGGRVGGVDVDIHFNPFGLISPLRAPQETWAASSSHVVRFGTTEIPIPSPEAHLLICLINLVRRGGGALRFYSDAARLIDFGIDWAEFWRLSRLEGLCRLTEQALYAVRRDLSLDVPVPVAGSRWWGPRIGEPPAGDAWTRRAPLHVLRLRPATVSDSLRLFRWYLPSELQREARA